MVGASYRRFMSRNWLLWIARILLLASAVSILIASCYFYNPRNFPFSNLSPQTGQTLLYGGLVLAIAGFAWLWPAPDGLLMLLFVIPAFYNLYESNYDFQIKLPAYILCLVFLASGVLYLITAWRQRRQRAG